MKRVLYIFLALGLAVSLVGCGESGGGYWPQNPASPASGGQVSSLGNNTNVVVAQNMLAPTGTNKNVQALQALGTSFQTGCPFLPTVNFNGTQPVTGFASILSASRSKTKTEATSAGVADTTVASSDLYSGYTKFAHSYSTSSSIDGSVLGSTDPHSCYTSVKYSWTYEMFVKYLDAQGAPIAVTSDSTNWYSLAAAPDQVYFFGMWKFEISSTDGKYDWSETSTFGSSTDPWHFTGLTTTPKTYGWMSVASAGTFNGTKVAGMSYKMMMKGRSDNYFQSPASGYPDGILSFETDGFTVIYTFDGTKDLSISYSPSAPTGAPTTVDLSS